MITDRQQIEPRPVQVDDRFHQQFDAVQIDPWHHDATSQQRSQRDIDIDATELEEVRLLVSFRVLQLQTAKRQPTAEQIDGG